jgi:hypothetical protein
MSRKDFFKYGAIIIGAPLIVSIDSSCSKIIDTGDTEFQSKIDRAIAEVPNFKLSNPLNKAAGEDVFKIPVSSVIFARKNVNIVTKVIHTKDSYRLQSLCVKLISKDDSFAYVTGLRNGDVLLLDQVKTIRTLAQVDKVGLRNRFLPIKKTN